MMGDEFPSWLSFITSFPLIFYSVKVIFHFNNFIRILSFGRMILLKGLLVKFTVTSSNVICEISI